MLKIGTRDHKIALWQATYTQAELTRIGVESELIRFKTEDSPSSDPEDTAGPGTYSKEIETALLRGELDLAVYAMQDMPANQAGGLAITAVSERKNPSDRLLIRSDRYTPDALLKLAPGSRVGASPSRRKTQLLAFRPDLQLEDIQGDMSSQLEQLRGGDFDAILLDAAVLEYLAPETTGLEVFELPPREFVPAPAQGVMAWQTNRDDIATRLLLKQIHHPEVSACTNVERRVLQLMEQDHLPGLGVFCERDPVGNFHVFAACAIQGQLHRARLSSSTSFGMAEKVVEALLGKH